MNIDIKAEAVKQKRHTFSHIARRFGVDKPASRYEEATFDVQPSVNFHYRPTYAPEFELYDPRRTRIVMADWYTFKDPRQFYYATYNISRSSMQQSFDSAMDFVEKRHMLDAMDAGWREKVAAYLIPLRHYEWGANMNCQLIADWGYGSQITSAAAFCGTDRLGLAQLLSRIGLAFGDGGDSALVSGKTLWMQAPEWQPLRRLVEDLWVVRDWFETFMAQLVIMDGLVYPLVFGAFDRAGNARGAAVVSLLTGFMNDWFADNSRWTDAVIKTAAAESEENRAILVEWAAHWSTRATAALLPLAEHVLGATGRSAFGEAAEVLSSRLTALGATAARENVA